ncbi:MAG: O-methyltransferase [Lachnospiraceae bacterium]|nr:O-methyltransferase [Lachnospiraceae bacterium]MCI1327381.1 O-methyltransferase [Lachnospiraceae bacterium]
MIIDPRMTVFLDSLDGGYTPFLEDLAKRAKEENVPIIRRSMRSLLRVLLEMNRPARILEVGTAVGFSSILMARYGPEDCRITTIENYEKRIREAEKNIAASGFGDRITLIRGDAGDVLKQLTDPFDFVFMDAAKGQYVVWLDDVVRLLCPGGVLLSDNVLQEGDLVESHYIMTRRNRTIYKRMRQYLYELTHREDLSTTILPVGDGAALTVKKQPR